MSKITNISNMHMILAGWLAHDGYDYNPDPNTISVTTLLKPLKQFILGTRVAQKDTATDVISRVASQTGTAIHEHVEYVWKNHKDTILASLGYPNRMIERFIVNPDKADLNDDSIPIYFEVRSEKQIAGYKISGKYDVVVDGVVNDIKKTSTYTYIKGNRDDDYRLQGSIYRWLNQDTITEDHMNILFVFTDWMASKAAMDKTGTYPRYPAMSHSITLLSLEETEAFILTKLTQIKTLLHAPEEDLPRCNNKDLWRDPPQYKYFSNPDGKRSTKNFDNLADANMHCATKGKGIVKTVPSKVKACNYCNAFDVCKQKEEYINNGDINPKL